jgi:hypothetical protein
MTNEPMPTWFLLYGGTSVDGRGPGQYQGRTTDRAVARRHWDQTRKAPYSVGYVQAVTDSTTRRINVPADWDAI